MKPIQSTNNKESSFEIVCGAIIKANIPGDPGPVAPASTIICKIYSTPPTK